MWLQFFKTVFQIFIWLAKKTTFIDMFEYGWKGNCFDRRVKNLKCGRHPPDRDELALLNVATLIHQGVEKWTYEGSGWKINLLIQHQLVISEIAPCEGSSYFSLPNELRNPMRGVMNILNKDDECFRWCLVRYLNPVNKNLANRVFLKNWFYWRKITCS